MFGNKKASKEGLNIIVAGGAECQAGSEAEPAHLCAGERRCFHGR